MFLPQRCLFPPFLYYSLNSHLFTPFFQWWRGNKIPVLTFFQKRMSIFLVGLCLDEFVRLTSLSIRRVCLFDELWFSKFIRSTRCDSSSSSVWRVVIQRFGIGKLGFDELRFGLILTKNVKNIFIFKKKVYDSYRKFRPNRFPENSPEWNMAMIQYLLDMKKHGQKIREIETSKVCKIQYFWVNTFHEFGMIKSKIYSFVQLVRKKSSERNDLSNIKFNFSHN